MGDAALSHRCRAIRGGAHARRRARGRRRAPALSRARGHGQHPRAHGRRSLGRLRRVPRAPLERPRADEGRDPLRPARLARGMRGARDVDDLEVRAPAAPLRRRQGRRPLQPEGDVARRGAAPDAALHDRAAAGDRPGPRHPRAGHGDERADDGLDDGHVLDAGGLRGAGGRHREADLDRRLRLPHRGDRRRRRDGDRAGLPEARLGPGRAGLRRAGVRQRRRRRRP